MCQKGTVVLQIIWQVYKGAFGMNFIFHVQLINSNDDLCNEILQLKSGEGKM